MKYERALALSVLMISLLLSGLARAQSSDGSKKQQSESSKSQQNANLKKAQDVVNRITPATPQEVHRSTDTATDVARRENDKEQHRQKGTTVDKTSVPSPTKTDKKNNPKGDADVQRGYDKHQKEAEKKKNPGL